MENKETEETVVKGRKRVLMHLKATYIHLNKVESSKSLISYLDSSVEENIQLLANRILML